MLVQLAVDGGGVDRHVRVGGLQRADALGRRQQAQELDGARMGGLDAIDGGDGRMAGGQHRIDGDDIAFGHIGRHLEVVLHRLQSLGVAVQAHGADAGVGHHPQQAIEHAVAGAQDAGKYQLLAVDHRARHLFQWGFDFDLLRRRVARDLIGHQHGQLAQQGAEGGAAGVLVAHQGQLVLHQRVGDVVVVSKL